MRMNRRQFIMAGAGAVTGLSLSEYAQSSSKSSSLNGETIIFHNGTVLPVDAEFSEHTALAIRGNKILSIGSKEHVMSTAGKGAKSIDLEGRTVLPGFIEPHMHFLLLAGLGHLQDISPIKYKTFDAILSEIRKISDGIASGNPDDWVMARQFDPILLEPPRELTTRELDEIVPDRPAYILNASGHIAYVNSKALSLAGIDHDTQNPLGGEYGRYEDGSLNGVLYGPAVHLPVLLKNEQISTRMQTGFVEAGKEVGAMSAALGITTLCDQATGVLTGINEIESFQRMYEGGEMKARIRAYLMDLKEDEWDKAGIQPGYGDALMRVSGWKMVVDGSNQGFTGRQREPYVGKESVGLWYIEPQELQEKVLKRARQGWPLSLHGNGDAAIDSILSAVAQAKEKGVDVNSLRCRIEHCSILHDEQISQMKELDIVPSFLINHVHYWGHVMRDNVFGKEKVQLLDRCASVDKAGLDWVMHTDAPVSPLGSLHKIRVAVVRDLWKEPETVLAPQERVSVEAAIRSVTITAAYACHSEKEIGSLEKGKLADLVILEEDPRKVDSKMISDIKISETWMDGNNVFRA